MGRTRRPATSTAERWMASSRRLNKDASQVPGSVQPGLHRVEDPSAGCDGVAPVRPPNYWSYATNYVLQDRMFESRRIVVAYPSTCLMVSGMVGQLPRRATRQSCRTRSVARELPGAPGFAWFPHDRRDRRPGSAAIYAWTDLTYLLHQNNVSWGYYVFGHRTRLPNDAALSCAPVKQNPNPRHLEPVALFRHRPPRRTTQATSSRRTNYYTEAKRGTLPAVSWIVPSNAD